MHSQDHTSFHRDRHINFIRVGSRDLAIYLHENGVILLFNIRVKDFQKGKLFNSINDFRRMYHSLMLHTALKR